MTTSSKPHAASFKLNGVRVARHAMLRVNCLPTDLLLELCPKQLAEAIEGRLAAESNLAALAPPVLDALERSVPAASDQRMRRLLLELRRNVFGSRCKQPSVGLLEWLQSTLTVHEWVDLSAWLHACDQLERRSMEIASHTGEGSQRLHQAMEYALTFPDFMHGLEAAAPRLAAQARCNRHKGSSKEARRIGRSLYAYVARASSKTSPFSTLTSSVPIATHAGSGSDRASAPAEPWRATSAASLNRGFATAMRAAIAERDPDLLGGLQVHPALLEGSDRSYLEHGRLEVRRASMWLEQYSAPPPDQMDLLSHLASVAAPFSVADAVTNLRAAGLDALEANRLIRRWVRRDVLRTPKAWTAHTRSPIAKLIGMLSLNQPSSSSTVDFVKDTVQALERIQSWSDAFTTAESSDRCSIPQKIRTEFEALHGAWSQAAAPDLRTPVYEDGWITPPPVAPGACFKAIIERISRVVASKIGISTDYAWLRDQFISYYGSGGVCEDAAAFCRRAWTDMSTRHVIVKTAQSGDIRTAESSSLGGTNVQVPLTLFVQFSGNGLDTLDNPDTQVVLNLAYNRIGWQTSRLTGCTLSDQQQFGLAVQSWLTAATAPREPVAIHISGACNNLQSSDRLTRRVLELERAAEGDDLCLADLVVSHDPAANMLVVADRKGTTLALTYLGSAVPMPAWGPRYVPILLSEPFAVGRPPSHMMLAPQQSGKMVHHQDRWEEDNVVLLRETWWVKSSLIIDSLAGLPPSRQVEVMCRMARENQIPFMVFATGQPRSSVVSNIGSPLHHRKPCWIDLRVAACLVELLGIADDSEWLVLRECLPDLRQQWLTQGGNGFVSEFMLEVVLDGSLSTQLEVDE